jgi:hypothetical protein
VAGTGNSGSREVTVLQLDEEFPTFLGTRWLRVLKLIVGFEDNVFFFFYAMLHMI